MTVFYFITRNEKSKVKAVKEYYETNANNEAKIVMILEKVGRIGTPIIFLVFAAIYWITGISKYFVA